MLELARAPGTRGKRGLSRAMGGRRQIDFAISHTHLPLAAVEKADKESARRPAGGVGGVARAAVRSLRANARSEAVAGKQRQNVRIGRRIGSRELGLEGSAVEVLVALLAADFRAVQLVEAVGGLRVVRRGGAMSSRIGEHLRGRQQAAKQGPAPARGSSDRYICS